MWPQRTNSTNSTNSDNGWSKRGVYPTQGASKAFAQVGGTKRRRRKSQLVPLESDPPLMAGRRYHPTTAGKYSHPGALPLPTKRASASEGAVGFSPATLSLRRPPPHHYTEIKPLPPTSSQHTRRSYASYSSKSHQSSSSTGTFSSGNLGANTRDNTSSNVGNSSKSTGSLKSSCTAPEVTVTSPRSGTGRRSRTHSRSDLHTGSRTTSSRGRRRGAMSGISGIMGKNRGLSPNGSDTGDIDEKGLIRRRHRMTPNQVCSHLIGRGLGDPRNNQRAVGGQTGFVVSSNVTSRTMSSKTSSSIGKQHQEGADKNYAPVIKHQGSGGNNQSEASKPLPNQNDYLAKSPNQLLPGDAVTAAINGIAEGSGGGRRTNYGIWAKLRAQAMVDNYRLHGKVREFCRDQEAITATGGVEEEVSFWEFVLPAYTRRNRPNPLVARGSDDSGAHTSEDEVKTGRNEEAGEDVPDGTGSQVNPLRLRRRLKRLDAAVDEDCFDGSGEMGGGKDDQAEVILVKNYSMTTKTPRANPSLPPETPRYPA